MGLCLWSRSSLGSEYVCVCGFVLVVGIGWVEAWFGLALLWAVVVDCGGGVDFLLVVTRFFCWRICEFVEFWLFLSKILVGFLDGFVANLVDLGYGNGGLWVVEVAVGCGWQWRWLGVLGLLFFKIFI